VKRRQTSAGKKASLTTSTAIAAIAVFVVLTIGKASLAAAENPLSSEAIARRIQEHRTAEITLTVADVTGKPASNACVTV
jgi:hypothetical protein